jgi:phosphate acetyltransferase
MGFIESIRERASKLGKTIVLPEGSDDRVIIASHILSKNHISRVVVLGAEESVNARASDLNIDLSDVEIIDPEKSDKLDNFAELYHEKRKHKGITLEEAKKIIKNPLFFGAAMVETGAADGSVAGAAHSTAHTVRAALHLIGVDPDFTAVSSFFIMVSPSVKFGQEGLMVFADCAVLPIPTSLQLAEIAIAAAGNARYFLETEPLVALLSFSTMGSAKHEEVERVAEALKIARERRPELQIDGEMQFDAAVVREVGERKAPGSKVAGRANTFIFPDLNSANIGYKIAQRMGKAEAVGPFLQGLKLPCNDLSRGCSVDDIVNTSAVTAIQASMLNK